VRPVLACAPQIRLAVRRMVRPAIERLPVLSYHELMPTLKLDVADRVGAPGAPLLEAA